MECDDHLRSVEYYIYTFNYISESAAEIRHHMAQQQRRSQTFQNEGVARGLRGERGGGLTGTQNGDSP